MSINVVTTVSFVTPQEKVRLRAHSYANIVQFKFVNFSPNKAKSYTGFLTIVSCKWFNLHLFQWYSIAKSNPCSGSPPTPSTLSEVLGIVECGAPGGDLLH